MSTLLLERSPALDSDVERGMDRGLDVPSFAGMADAHGRLTLDELITSVWEGLAVRGAVNCPVCESPMAARAHRGSEEPLSGMCFDCGSQLC